MNISARNQFLGKVIEIKEGAVNSIVKLEIAGGNHISATISVEAVKELGLAVGSEATAIIKATSVMIATETLKISARNQLCGKITKINEGSVNAIVSVEIAGGNHVSATISLEAVRELGLVVGKEVTAIVKSTSVMMAV